MGSGHAPRLCPLRPPSASLGPRITHSTSLRPRLALSKSTPSPVTPKRDDVFQNHTLRGLRLFCNVDSTFECAKLGSLTKELHAGLSERRPGTRHLHCASSHLQEGQELGAGCRGVDLGQARHAASPIHDVRAEGAAGTRAGAPLEAKGRRRGPRRPSWFLGPGRPSWGFTVPAPPTPRSPGRLRGRGVFSWRRGRLLPSSTTPRGCIPRGDPPQPPRSHQPVTRSPTPPRSRIPRGDPPPAPQVAPSRDPPPPPASPTSHPTVT